MKVSFVQISSLPGTVVLDKEDLRGFPSSELVFKLARLRGRN
jgi:hypothetical protein